MMIRAVIIGCHVSLVVMIESLYFLKLNTLNTESITCTSLVGVTIVARIARTCSAVAQTPRIHSTWNSYATF